MLKFQFLCVTVRRQFGEYRSILCTLCIEWMVSLRWYPLKAEETDTLKVPSRSLQHAAFETVSMNSHLSKIAIERRRSGCPRGPQ